jgi:mono/diheme cytochrome c family protein
MIRRRIARALAWGAGTLVALVVAFIAWVELRWDRPYDVPYPTLTARTDSATIARGRYLAYGPAHCASCHVSPTDRARFRAGEETPLAGGGRFALPVGTWYPANLTPDPATGIGRWSDAQLARALRRSIGHDGRPLVAMSFTRLADEDIVAVMSFLRAQQPVRNVVPPRRIGFVGRALFATIGKPALVPPAPHLAPRGDDVARGAYVANEIAGCDDCHTARSLTTGKSIGPAYAGGTKFPEKDAAGRPIVSPNLTGAGPGPIAAWSEAQFVERFRAGRLLPKSPMHWESFGRMSDADLRAVYRYLRTLPARGSESVNLAPRPGTLDAERSPPMPRARSREIASPSPTPS